MNRMFCFFVLIFSCVAKPNEEPVFLNLISDFEVNEIVLEPAEGVASDISFTQEKRRFIFKDSTVFIDNKQYNITEVQNISSEIKNKGNFWTYYKIKVEALKEFFNYAGDNYLIKVTIDKGFIDYYDEFIVLITMDELYFIFDNSIYSTIKIE